MSFMKKISPFKETSISFVRKRLDELGVSIAEAERRASVPKDTIQKMLLGSGTDYENYLAVMRFLRYTVPLYGKLISGKGIVMADAATKEQIQVSIPESIEYSPDLLPVQVSDDSYTRHFLQGIFFYFKATGNKKPVSLTAIHPHVVKIKNGLQDVMIIRAGSKAGKYTLLAIDSSAKVIQDAELEWCAPIEGTSWEY